MAEQSIKSLFASAERQRLEIESSRDSNTAAYQENLAAAITNYHNCLQLADRISLFSPNETLEDLSSGDLQYLLINYHLAELILRIAGNDRKLVLQKARETYEEFLSLLYQYELLKGQHKKLYNLYLEAPTTFSTISTTDGASLRNTKMANYALERELKKQLEFLSQNPAYLQNDDDAVRNVQLTNTTLCTHNTFQQLEFINKEADILAMAPPIPPTGPELLERDHRQRTGGLRDNTEYSDKLDIIPSTDFRTQFDVDVNAKHKNRRLHGMVEVYANEKQKNRQERTKAVFGSSHNPPTMTIDEYLEYEKATGGIIEGGGEASGREPTPDEDNYEKGDEETYKARRWDDYTEEHQKGSGNTLNRG